MKNSLIILTAVILGLISCQKEGDSTTIATTEFDFVILGNIENGEGIELSLYIPSQGLDNRIKSTVKNGAYLFKGKSLNIEQAEIRFEENIIDESSMYAYMPLFIEPDTTQLDFAIAGDSLLRHTDQPKVLRGANNKFYYDAGRVYAKYFSVTIYSDKIRIDSMHKYVYPKVRKNLLRVYDSLFLNSQFPGVALAVLNSTLNNVGPFQFDKLNENEKEKFIEFFHSIDTSLAETPDYRMVKNNIEKLRLVKSNIIFKDFELIDINDKKVKLSEVIRDNKYTLLYFWWSGCAPCRTFNRETTAEKYSLLKENGIEIISISVDESNQRWKKSSNRDTIMWTNLYAGAVSDIKLGYNVEAFPTKIIFDNDFNVINFKFKDASELLELTKR